MNASNIIYPSVYNNYCSSLLCNCYTVVKLSKQRISSSFLRIMTGLYHLPVLERPLAFQMQRIICIVWGSCSSASDIITHAYGVIMPMTSFIDAIVGNIKLGQVFSI